jgi:PIN domain nuclease of toxin-antitoxin system
MLESVSIFEKKQKIIIYLHLISFFEVQILKNYGKLHMPPESSQNKISAKKPRSIVNNVSSFHFTHKPKIYLEN